MSTEEVGRVMPPRYQPEREIFTKVPKANQTLQPWVSVIHWPQTSHDNDPVRGVQWLVPVTCGVCGETRNLRLNRVAQSPKLSAGNLSSNEGETFTGLHNVCMQRRSNLETELPDGTTLSPWEITEKGTSATCGNCNASQFVQFSRSDDVITFTRKCVRCEHILGEQEHPTGAKIYWLNFWLKRAYVISGERSSGRRVPFACASCGVRDQVQHSHIWLKGRWVGKWMGRCADCYKKRVGHPKKITGDFCMLPFRSVALYSKRRGDVVPIECGLIGCGKVNDFHYYSPLSGRTTGYCRNHTAAEIYLCSPMRVQQDNGQENGSAEKNRHGDTQNVKHERRAPRFDRDKFVARVKKFVVEVWREKGMKSPDKITRKDIALKFSLHGWKPTTGAGVWANLEACEELVDVSEGWTAFVLDVLKETNEKS